MKKICRIDSYDWADSDVIINASFFYEACGYQIKKGYAGILLYEVRGYRVKKFYDSSKLDILVVLRGRPAGVDKNVKCPVHVYEYTKNREDEGTDWRYFFPAAQEIVVISLSQPLCRGWGRWVKAYIPVIPDFWQTGNCSKQETPVHIANYKPMAGDAYQAQIIYLIKAGKIQVYGNNWHKAGIKAKSLSYWDAGKKMAHACSVIGLMYPFQRGKTISGRMWQAPLNGTLVFTEPKTDIYSCPGLVEAEDLEKALVDKPNIQPAELAEAARKFWLEQNAYLAQSLGLVIEYKSKRYYSCFRRKLILYLFHIKHYFAIMILGLWRFYKRVRNWLARKFNGVLQALQARRMLKLIRKRPLYLNIETINICNAHCVFCCYGKTKIKPQVLPLDIFEKVIREYSQMGGGAVSLTPVPGEVLLDPHLLQRYEIMAKYKNIDQISFTTNGIAFEKYSDEEIKYLIRSSYMIQVSIGGLDREGYKSRYQVDQFENVMNAVARLLNLKKSIDDDCLIHLAFRTGEADFEEKHRKDLEAYRSQGCLVSHLSSFGNFGGIVRSEEAKNVSIMDGSGLDKRDVCVFPRLMPALLPNGLITNCGCVDVNGDSLIIGDARHDTLSDCWSSKERKNILDSFRQGKLVELCRQCSLYRPSAHLASPVYKNIRSYQKLPLEFYMFYGG